MAFDIASVLAGLVGGAFSGAAAAAITPWAAWGAEKSRLRTANRRDRVAAWRRGIEDLRQAEDSYVPPRTVIVGDTRTSDEVHANPSLFDVTTKSWFVTLKPELTHSAKGMVEQLAKQPLRQRKGLVPKVLADEVTRIEQQKWKLV